MKTLSSIINSINNDVKAYIGLTIAMFSICGLAFAFQLSQLAAVLRLAVPVFLGYLNLSVVSTQQPHNSRTSDRKEIGGLGQARMFVYGKLTL